MHKQPKLRLGIIKHILFFSIQNHHAANREHCNQTARTRSLIRVFAVRTCCKVHFLWVLFISHGLWLPSRLLQLLRVLFWLSAECWYHSADFFFFFFSCMPRANVGHLYPADVMIP